MSMSLLTSNFWWLTPSCDLVGPSKDSTHTLWLCQNSYGKWPIYRWFTYKKWWCSIVKLVYQRVLHLKHHAKSDRLCDRLIYFPVLWWTLAGLIFWVPPSPFIPTISRKLTGTLRQSNVAMERCQHIYIYIYTVYTIFPLKPCVWLWDFPLLPWSAFEYWRVPPCRSHK